LDNYPTQVDIIGCFVQQRMSLINNVHYIIGCFVQQFIVETTTTQQQTEISGSARRCFGRVEVF